MSVQSATSKISYAGNNSVSTPYTVPFYFFDNSHLVVVVKNASGVETTLTLTTDFTVSGAANPSGGSVTTIAAYDSTNTVTIYRSVPVTQSTSYVENDKFPAASHEAALDKLTFIAQQNSRAIASCLRVTESSANPAPAAPANLTVAGIDGSGNSVFRTVQDMIAFLSLSGAVSAFPGATWANATERAAKIPDYIGQIGFQKDTHILYYSTALTAGSWTAYVYTNLANSILTAMIADAQVTAAKMATDSVATTNVIDANITAAKLASGAVTAAKMGTAGMVLQSVTGTYSTNADLTTHIPNDDTIPQNTEGTQILSVAITPTITSSLIRVRFSGFGCDGSGDTITTALFNGASGAVSATAANASANLLVPLSLSYISGAVGALTPITFSIRVGANSTTMRMNGNASGRFYGGVAAATLIVEEIHG